MTGKLRLFWPSAIGTELISWPKLADMGFPVMVILATDLKE